MTHPSQGVIISQTDHLGDMRFAPPRVEKGPIGYRLGRRNGELTLQGAYQWAQGLEGGVEWRDVPTVELDDEQPRSENV